VSRGTYFLGRYLPQTGPDTAGDIRASLTNDPQLLNVAAGRQAPWPAYQRPLPLAVAGAVAVVAGGMGESVAARALSVAGVGALMYAGWRWLRYPPQRVVSAASAPVAYSTRPETLSGGLFTVPGLQPGSEALAVNWGRA
jgi:hypothetical protein